jgi:ABC-2 type transport system ATP-binding protein
MPILLVKNLEARIGPRVILAGASLEIDSGECCLLLGQNGSGKTTLIRCIVDLIKPTIGEVFIIERKNQAEPVKVKKNFGLISDDNPLIQDFSALQYLDFIGILHKIPLKERRERISVLYKYFFDTLDDLKRPIYSYSSGMKKKLSFCAANLHQPKLLILDEPFNGLDPDTQVKAIDFLKSYKEKGNAILLTSHFFNGLDQIVSHVALIEDKTIIYNDVVSDFLINPQMRDKAHSLKAAFNS